MNKTSLELIQERQSIVAQMKDLAKLPESENRDFNSDEQVKWDKMISDESALTSRIQRAKKFEADDAKTGKTIELKGGKEVDASYRSAFEHYFRNGKAGMSDQMLKTLEAGKEEKRGTATQITTTDTLGGYLVPEEFSNEVIKSLKDFGGMFEAARIYTTGGGGVLNWPTFNGTATVGNVQTPEGSAIPVNDMAFGEFSLSAHTYTSGVVKASKQLVQDAFFNIEAFINDELVERYSRKANTDLTIGDGTNKARGINQDVTQGVAGAAITRAGIIDLIHSVDAGYRRSSSAALMMNDSSLAAIKKLSIGSADDRPLWTPGSMVNGHANMIEGYNVIVNNDLPDIGAGNKAILFGDFSKYIIRAVNGMGLGRSDQRYFEELAIGFLAWRRLDGRLMDLGAVKAFVGA